MEIFNSNFIVDNKERYKNLNILKDLTIVIPIRNEAFDDVLFAVEYYSLLERNILIIDGSIDELPHLGKQNNLHYIHKKDTNIHDRIKYSLNRIKTKYILLVALDDFVVLDSIIEGLELINKYNCEYVTGPAIS